MIIYPAPIPQYCGIGSVTVNARVLHFNCVAGIVNSCFVDECHNSTCDKTSFSFLSATDVVRGDGPRPGSIVGVRPWAWRGCLPGLCGLLVEWPWSSPQGKVFFISGSPFTCDNLFRRIKSSVTPFFLLTQSWYTCTSQMWMG